MSILNYIFHPDILWLALKIALALSASLLILGSALRRRALEEAGGGALVWGASVAAANAALIALFEPYTFDSPEHPRFVAAPLLGAALLAVGAAGGAVARRWRPWPGVWLAAATSAAMASAVVAWAHLDRVVIYPRPITHSCFGIKLSFADVVWLEGEWALVALLAGAASAVVHAAARRVPTRAIQRAADALLVCVIAATASAAWRCATLPQPGEYAASVPVVGTAQVDRIATYEDFGLSAEEIAEAEERLQDLERLGFPPPTRYHLAIRGQAPPDLTLFAAPGLFWRWGDGPAEGSSNPFPDDAVLSLRHDAAAGWWLITDGDKPIAALRPDPAAKYDPMDTSWEAWRAPRLPWAEVAGSLAPPTSWTVAAALSALAALLLRATPGGSARSQRTLAAMRLAALAAGATPLLVAAWRGFV